MIHHQKGKNLSFMMVYVRLRKTKPVKNCGRVEHRDAEKASLVYERVYSCGILTGIRRRCQASADRLLI